MRQFYCLLKDQSPKPQVSVIHQSLFPLNEAAAGENIHGIER